MTAADALSLLVGRPEQAVQVVAHQVVRGRVDKGWAIRRIRAIAEELGLSVELVLDLYNQAVDREHLELAELRRELVA